MHSWISDEFLSGPPGYCESERVRGPFLATEEQARKHAKANIGRMVGSVSDVRTPISNYTLTEHDDDDRLFKNIYVRVVGMRYHGNVSNIDNVRLVEENDNPYDDQAVAAYAGDVQFGYLTRDDARFYRALPPVKNMRLRKRGVNHIDISLEL
jgi:hypothetical protein